MTLITVWSGAMERDGRCEGLSSPRIQTSSAANVIASAPDSSDLKAPGHHKRKHKGKVITRKKAPGKAHPWRKAAVVGAATMSGRTPQTSQSARKGS